MNRNPWYLDKDSWFWKPGVTFARGLRNAIKYSKNIPSKAKNGYETAKQKVYGSLYEPKINKSSAVILAGDSPQVREGEWFAYKFYKETNRLPELKHFKRVFGDDLSSKYYEGYMKGVSHMYNNYKQGFALLDSYTNETINNRQTIGFVPKKHSVALWDTIRRANNSPIAPRLGPRMEKIAKYLAIPGGALFVSAAPGMIAKTAGNLAADVLNGAVATISTGKLNQGLKDYEKRTGDKVINVPRLDKVTKKIKEAEHLMQDNGHLPGTIWNAAIVNATKAATNIYAENLVNEQPVKVENSNFAYVSPSIGVPSNPSAGDNTGFNGGGGGGGGSSFFFNGRQNNYNYPRYNRRRYRRFRRYPRKNYNKYNKRYRKHRRFY